MSAIDKIQNETTRRFAEATYDEYHNNIAALPSDVDEVDMTVWGITEAQWLEALSAAREDIKEDAE